MNLIRSIPIFAIAATCAAQPDTTTRPLRVLIDTDLNRHLIELVSIDDSHITYIDSAGNQLAAPAANFVALAPVEPWHAPTPPRGITRAGLLELTDGQRLLGTPSVATTDDESLAWNHARLGLVSVPLESVRRLAVPRIMPAARALPPLTADTEDVLRLTNGDTLRGFIAAFSADAVIELDSGSTISTPMNVVDEMALANPPAPPEGIRLWLTGGNVISIDEIAPTRSDQPEQLSAILPTAPFTGIVRATSEADGDPPPLTFDLDRSAIEAINFDAAALLPLASLESTATGRDLSIDPFALAALSARDIHLPGPMTVTWTLPEGAARLALTATLPLQARAWGDLELIISLDGSESQRHALSAQSPEAHIRLDLTGARELTIELTEGNFGPVQDQATLREALVLIER